ncbi:MAG: 3-keto-L-gulonate-6-phosphate decarboxylase UlaD [Brevinemataceae bacterium]
MALPLLQLALDNTSLEDVLESTRILVSELDVIEAGTVLMTTAGTQALRALRALYPDHIIVSDIKVADAGGLLAKTMIGENGANWMTVICAAPIATFETALNEAQKYPNGDIQAELFGNWTFEEATEWRKIGIKQAIYHRGRDAQAAGQTWGEIDIQKIARLAKMGFEVSVTGGLEISDLRLFKGIPVKAFIAGRTLRDAVDPIVEARGFKDEMAKWWS